LHNIWWGKTAATGYRWGQTLRSVGGFNGSLSQRVRCIRCLLRSRLPGRCDGDDSPLTSLDVVVPTTSSTPRRGVCVCACARVCVRVQQGCGGRVICCRRGPGAPRLLRLRVITGKKRIGLVASSRGLRSLSSISAAAIKAARPFPSLVIGQADVSADCITECSVRTSD